jgi:hypothetical protein
MIETIKEISKKCNPVFVGGVASYFNGYRKSWNDVKDIDIILTQTNTLEGVSVRQTKTIFDKTNRRGNTYINDYLIDIFITTIKPQYINTIEVDGVSIRYINKKGQKRYYKNVIRKTSGRLKKILTDKYRGELSN